MTVSAFVVFVLVYLALWIAAIVLLVKNGSKMPTWALVVAIISLFVLGLGPIIAIILALATVKKGRK